MSRAERRKAERERRKREKKEAIQQKQRDRRSKSPDDRKEAKKKPWNATSPSCPVCGSDWTDKGDRYSCKKCGRVSLKTDLDVEECERCERLFLLESLVTWTDTNYNDHRLCSDCMTQVWVHSDMEWLEKRE